MRRRQHGARIEDESRAEAGRRAAADEQHRHAVGKAPHPEPRRPAPAPARNGEGEGGKDGDEGDDIRRQAHGLFMRPKPKGFNRAALATRGSEADHSHSFSRFQRTWSSPYEQGLCRHGRARHRQPRRGAGPRDGLARRARRRSRSAPLAVKPVCLTAAETREEVKARRLLEPFAALKFAAAQRKAEALSAKLCHTDDEFIYEITLLHRDGRLVHVQMDAGTGKPVSGAARPHEAHEPPEEPNRKNERNLPMRLLVVEDDRDLNRQVSSALEAAGYAVDRAFDGEEGWFRGDTEPYDAVVLDIGLPKRDGISVLEAWRKAGRDDAGPDPDGARPLERQGAGHRRGRRRLCRQALPHGGGSGSAARASAPRRGPRHQRSFGRRRSGSMPAPGG